MGAWSNIRGELTTSYPCVLYGIGYLLLGPRTGVPVPFYVARLVEHSGTTQEISKEHISEHSGGNQGAVKEHSRNIQGTLREH
jgi:hypothetical protein